MENKNHHTIYRYPIQLSSAKVCGKETTTLKLPAGAMLVSASYTEWKPNEIQMYYIVNMNTNNDTSKEVEILTVGTGHCKLSSDILNRLQFVSTIVRNKVEEVHHVFIVKPKLESIRYTIPGEKNENS